MSAGNPAPRMSRYFVRFLARAAARGFFAVLVAAARGFFAVLVAAARDFFAVLVAAAVADRAPGRFVVLRRAGFLAARAGFAGVFFLAGSGWTWRSSAGIAAAVSMAITSAGATSSGTA